MEELIQEAFKAIKNSYSPYSHFPVGAALRCKDGRIFYGANVENAAYGSTMCAERNAVYNAYSNGVRADDVLDLAIVSYGNTLSYCCGACRQVLVELLNGDTPIYLSNGKQTLTTTPDEMTPHSFTGKDLL